MNISNFTPEKIPIPTHPKFKNFLEEGITKIGRLEIKEYAGIVNSGKYKYHFWLCKCECGNELYIRSCSIGTGTNSCGCLLRELLEDRNTTHGLNGTPEYSSWQNMKNRCDDPNNPDYHYYGGRGIIYIDRWGKFENFSEDMGEKPEPKHLYSLDRWPNNDGNYEKDNCRWATVKEQANNKRSNFYIEYNNEIKTLTEWSKIIGISVTTLRKRLLTLSPIDAFTKELLKKKPVLQLDKNTGKQLNEFESVAEAARQLEIGQRGIFKCFDKKNPRKTSGGFIWKMKDS